MTTNQTISGVPRELLYRVSDPYRPNGQEKARAELRALLDAPAESCGACNGCTNGCRLDAESPPSQPQGEPVAYRWRVKGHANWTASLCKVEFDARANDDRFVAQALYAEQPAPVAVVLPEQLIAAIEAEQERLSQEDYLMDSEDCVKVIREEVTRLNPSL